VTPCRAPIGYLNVRNRVLGQEIRTVEVDPVRAPFIQWAFESYAMGESSIKRIVRALEDKGLVTVPSAHWSEKPLNESAVHRMLRNRYYLGKVVWQGIEHDGNHPPLIDALTFQRVQDVMDSHRVGEKQRVHLHYLKGSVWCANCGSRLCVTKPTNRHGQQYSYFMCLGRHQKRTECTQRSLPIELVEAKIEDKWRHVQIQPEYADALREMIESEIAKRQDVAERDRAVARRRIRSLTKKQAKLLEAHYADAIPVSLLKSEQDRIAAELASTYAVVAASEITFEKIGGNLRHALAFLTNCHDAYLRAPTRIRRQMNQAVFERFLVGEDGSTDAEPAGVFGVLLSPDIIETSPAHDRADETASSVHRNCDWQNDVPVAVRSIWRKQRAIATNPGELSLFEREQVGTPNGIRTRAAGVKGRSPRPLDDGGLRAE